MDRARVFLRGGASFDIEAEEIEITKNRLENEITRISYKGTKSDDGPVYIRLDEIVAVLWVPAKESS